VAALVVTASRCRLNCWVDPAHLSGGAQRACRQLASQSPQRRPPVSLTAPVAVALLPLPRLVCRLLCFRMMLPMASTPWTIQMRRNPW
jgi:hypothetical protein